MTIPLGKRSPFSSSNLPGPQAWKAAQRGPYLILLPVGFAVPVRYRTSGALLPHHFTLARTPAQMNERGPLAVSFCCTFRQIALPRRYLAPSFREVRTFLPCRSKGGHPTVWRGDYAPERALLSNMSLRFCLTRAARAVHAAISAPQSPRVPGRKWRRNSRRITSKSSCEL